MAVIKKSFPLRLDPKIYMALEKWSQDELRSVNAHIEYLLRQALIQSGRLTEKTSVQMSGIQTSMDSS